REPGGGGERSGGVGHATPPGRVFDRSTIRPVAPATIARAGPVARSDELGANALGRGCIG
ncbi:MAG: hypothetical protein ACKOFW_16575, partial [Planctomycetaceae bacterium]